MNITDYNNALKNITTTSTYYPYGLPLSGVSTQSVTLGTINAPNGFVINYSNKPFSSQSPFNLETPETWEDFLGYIKDWLEFAENDLSYLKNNPGIKKIPEALKIIAGTLTTPEEFENLVMETKTIYEALKEEKFDIARYLSKTMGRGHNYVMSDLHTYVLNGLKKFRNISRN
jgi:hypothetical protein